MVHVSFLLERYALPEMAALTPKTEQKSVSRDVCGDMRLFKAMCRKT
jgi:hypothetical protein